MGASPGSVAVVIVRRRADGAIEVWRQGDLGADAPGAIPTADCRPGEDIFAAASRVCENVALPVGGLGPIEPLGELSRGPGARPRALMRVLVTGEGDGGGGVWASVDDPAFDAGERAWIRAATAGRR